ncbi:MAG: hypothetical protein LBS55_00095 [Prevotellaceae bacterium]|nr:hypothetical protein [Prevotellaceae bacterium]
MKKLLCLLFLVAVLAGCGKNSACYDCKNANNQVVQTYCDVTQAEAESKSALWTNRELLEISHAVMSDATRRSEERRVTIVRCDEQHN